MKGLRTPALQMKLHDRLVFSSCCVHMAQVSPLKNAFSGRRADRLKKFQLRSSRFLLAWDLPCHLGLRDASPALGLGSPLSTEGMAAPLSN